MRRTACLADIALALAVLVGAGACSSGADGDEQAVCNSIQSIVDDLAVRRGDEALASLADLDEVVGATSNAVLAESGERFLAAITPTTNYGELTVEEHIALGNQVLEDSTSSLDALGDECARLGEPIEADLTALDPIQ